MIAAVQMGRLRATYPRALANGSDGVPLGSASARAAENAVAELWAQAWSRLRAECPDLDERWASAERCPSVARTMASAGRCAGRVLRGEASPSELLKKLLVWQVAVIDTLAVLATPDTTILTGRPGAFSTPSPHGRARGSSFLPRCPDPPVGNFQKKGDHA